MFIITRKRTPQSPVECFETAFDDREDAVGLIESFGVAEWQEIDNGLVAEFSDGSVYMVHDVQHHPIVRH